MNHPNDVIIKIGEFHHSGNPDFLQFGKPRIIYPTRERMNFGKTGQLLISDKLGYEFHSPNKSIIFLADENSFSAYKKRKSDGRYVRIYYEFFANPSGLFPFFDTHGCLSKTVNAYDNCLVVNVRMFMHGYNTVKLIFPYGVTRHGEDVYSDEELNTFFERTGFER